MAKNQHQWGRDTARERYGSVEGGLGKTESSEPQFKADAHDAKYDNDVDANSWLRRKAEEKEGYAKPWSKR